MQYKYLTGKKILPSDEKQIVEQAKFTYLRFSFGKQMKTIEDQGEKQIKAIQDKWQVKTIKRYTYDDEDNPFISKQKEIFHKLIDERLEKISDSDKEVNYDDVIYKHRYL